MGMDIKLKELHPTNSETIKTYTNKLPVYILTSNTLVLTHKDLEQVYKSFTKVTTPKEIYTWFSSDQIEKMKASAKMSNFLNEIDSEDYLDYVLLFLSFLTVPVSTASLYQYCRANSKILALCCRKRKTKPKKSSKSKNNVKLNRRIIKAQQV